MQIQIIYPRTPFTDATQVSDNRFSGMPEELVYEPMDREEIIKQAVWISKVVWGASVVDEDQGVLCLTYSGYIPAYIKRVLSRLAVRGVITVWNELAATH